MRKGMTCNNNIKLYHVLTLLFYLMVPIIALNMTHKHYLLWTQIGVTLLAFMPVLRKEAFRNS